MSVANRNGPDSDRRWWEIRGDRDSGEGRYGELVTGGRGRMRPERSLSAGAGPAEEPRRRLHALLWPVVSVVAATALILIVVFVVPKGTSTPAESTTSPVAAVPGSPRGDAPGATFGLPAPLANPPTGGGGGGLGGGGLPQPGGAPFVPTGGSNGLGAVPVMPGGPVAATPTPTPTPSPTASSPLQSVKVYGPAPAAPGPKQSGKPVPGTGGCVAGGTEPACPLTRDAPAFLPGATDPTGTLPANRYPFLCQSDGSAYVVGNRANHWWAWAGNSPGAWIPVLFLAGGPDSGPVPGLPVCEGASPSPTVKSTTTPSPTVKSTPSSLTTSTTKPSATAKRPPSTRRPPPKKTKK